MHVHGLRDLNDNGRQPESARRLGPPAGRQPQEGEEGNPAPWGDFDFAITP